jgi:hypothetical protein
MAALTVLSFLNHFPIQSFDRFLFVLWMLFLQVFISANDCTLRVGRLQVRLSAGNPRFGKNLVENLDNFVFRVTFAFSLLCYWHFCCRTRRFHRNTALVLPLLSLHSGFDPWAISCVA